MEIPWRCQNEALWIATCCHKMAPTDHLHQETKLPPIRSHSELPAKQYWLSCCQSHHPSCHPASPARNTKSTLDKFDRDVVPLPDDVISDVEAFSSTLRTLDSQAVADTLSNLVPNTVLLNASVRVPCLRFNVHC